MAGYTSTKVSSAYGFLVFVASFSRVRVTAITRALSSFVPVLRSTYIAVKGDWEGGRVNM